MSCGWGGAGQWRLWLSHLSEGLPHLAPHQECLQRFGDSLQEMVNYHMVSPVIPPQAAPSWGPQAPPSLDRVLGWLWGRPRFSSSRLWGSAVSPVSADSGEGGEVAAQPRDKDRTRLLRSLFPRDPEARPPHPCPSQAGSPETSPGLTPWPLGDS